MSTVTARPWGWRASHSGVSTDMLGEGGCFETIRAYRGRVFALSAHVERLAASARTLGFRLPATPRAIRAAIARAAARHATTDATIRIMIVRQPGGRTQLVIIARPLKAPPRRWYTHGITVVTTVAYRGSPAAVPPQAKHQDIGPGVMAHLDGARNADEFLYRSDGCVAEGTISNMCIVTKAGELLSPPVSHGALAGVTCHALFAVAAPLGLTARWQPLTRHDVWNAAEVLLTNSMFEVVPVVRYDGRVIGSGRPGPWTRRLHAALQTHIKQEVRDAR